MECGTRIILLTVGLMLVLFAQGSPVAFDVRQHLSTTSRYGVAKAVSDNVDDFPPVPSGCEPIHLNLVARHGTRAPTKNNIDKLDLLASRLAKQLEEIPEGDVNRPVWLPGFRSPWEGRKVGGELIPAGEEDMYHLGQRMRQRFPELFKYNYHPEIYPLTATQVARSSASAVAFGMGLFGGTGSLGPNNQRAFSVITDSRKDDIHLRFHESCVAYKQSKKLRKPKVRGWQDEIYRDVGSALSSRAALNLTTDDTASLWVLCKNEASILDITDRACGLFTAAEVELLEWADDLEAHHLKSYGEAINYRMGVPLLQEVVSTMDRAVAASEGAEFPGALEMAKLRVAHAETVIPFSCLLGLFLEEPDVRKLQTEEPLEYALRPPNLRLWKGSLVAPFGANTQLILYKCPKTSGHTRVHSAVAAASSEYIVQVLHNEKPVTMPACKGKHYCPFTEFKEAVAAPHLHYSFESLCSVESEPEYVPPKGSWTQSFIQVIRDVFRWPFRSSPDLYTSQVTTMKEL